MSEKCDINVLFPTPVRPITAMTVSSVLLWGGESISTRCTSRRESSVRSTYFMSGTAGCSDERSFCVEEGELAGIGFEGFCPMLGLGLVRFWYVGR